MMKNSSKVLNAYKAQIENQTVEQTDINHSYIRLLNSAKFAWYMHPRSRSSLVGGSLKNIASFEIYRVKDQIIALRI